MNRDAIIRETLRLHDMQYGKDHCDRKYVEVCGAFQSLLYDAGKNLRAQREQRPQRQPDIAVRQVVADTMENYLSEHERRLTVEAEVERLRTGLKDLMKDGRYGTVYNEDIQRLLDGGA
jgi:hypothetical protein